MNQFNRKHIAASLLTIATCLVVLCSVALAFFSSEVKNSGNHLQIAQYELGVSLSESVSTADISWDEVNNYYVINNTGNYTFILRAKGNSTGYCKVTIIRPMTDEGETPTEQTYYTAQIKPPIAADNQDAPISLILNGVVAGSRITLTPIWGKYTSNDTVNIAEGSNTITIGEPLVVQQLSLRESEETELEESEETVARIEFEEDEEATAGTELEEDADEEPIGESPAN